MAGLLPHRSPALLYSQHEIAFRTQYAELKERSQSAGLLLPGTPGRLVLRHGTGLGYWYRSYYAAPGRETEDFVCKDGDAALDAARDSIAFADWAARQVRDLRKLQFQVADKAVARVLVQLHNTGLFDNGLVMVGSLAYMAWLNELGAKAVAARTQDIDLARRQGLKLAAPLSLPDMLQATKLKFVAVPGMPGKSTGAPSTAMKLAGAEGLRVDILTAGQVLGQVVPVPELQWHAQTIPHFDYLLREPCDAAMLAGGHCVALKLPAPERLVWHKLYASASRKGFPEKAQKDLIQAATLAAVLVELDDSVLTDAFKDVPKALVSAARSRLPALRRVLAAQAQVLQQFEDMLAG